MPISNYRNRRQTCRRRLAESCGRSSVFGALRKDLRFDTMRNRTAYVAVAAMACIIASIAGATARWRDGDGFTRPVAEAVVHYAPTENLEHIDVALIDHAETSIDMAAYVLTDWAVIRLRTSRLKGSFRSDRLG